MKYLLDVNVVIALANREHQDFRRCRKWLHGLQDSNAVLTSMDTGIPGGFLIP